jgi:hypothetical protein
MPFARYHKHIPGGNDVLHSDRKNTYGTKKSEAAIATDCTHHLAYRSIFVTIIILSLQTFSLSQANAGNQNEYSDAQSRRQAKEYEIKAAYLYNFLLFVDWPEPKQNSQTDESKPPIEKPPAKTITIGIIGKDSFGDNFNKVEGKLIKSKNKRLSIKRFGRFRRQQDLDRCDLLFFCSSEMKNIDKILAGIKGNAILTVGETSNFLERGGIINLLKVGTKIKWEINRTPAKKSGLKIRAQLLRNAVRVVEIPKMKTTKANTEDTNNVTAPSGDNEDKKK